MCGHRVSRTRLCCRPFVTIYCVPVPADTFVLQNSVLRAHMCVSEGRSSWSQFAFAGLAYVSVFECTSTCATEASNHPLSRFL